MPGAPPARAAAGGLTPVPEFRESAPEGATLRSLQRGSALGGSNWDERRILRLERDVEQVLAGQKLVERRLASALTTARIALGAALLALALLVLARSL
jgi:hypothetical protein